MAIRAMLLSTALAVLTLPLAPGRAQASEVLMDSTGFVQGTQSFVQTFDLSSPGTLTVQLSNIDWPQSLSSLSLLLTSANGLVGSEMMQAGTETFDITHGGLFFVQWFGTAQGPLNTGVYGLDVSFQPAAGTTVPLPSSLALLLSGLALLVWQRRVHADAGEGGWSPWVGV